MTTETVAAGAQPAGEHALTAGQYITHHLGHMRSQPQPGIIDFHVINYDTILWSVLMALLAFFLLRAAASRVTSGVPSRSRAPSNRWWNWWKTNPRPSSTATAALL